MPYPDVARNSGVEEFDDPDECCRGPRYDTALSAPPAAVRSVLEVTDVSRILFGTDWPFPAALFPGPEALPPG